MVWESETDGNPSVDADEPRNFVTDEDLTEPDAPTIGFGMNVCLKETPWVGYASVYVGLGSEVDDCFQPTKPDAH